MRALCVLALLVIVARASHGATLSDGVAALNEKRYAEAMAMFVPLANGGDHEAQRLVGEMSFKGQGVKADSKAAFAWTELAAAGGNAIAQYNLGYLYEHGEGTARSDQDAIAWYTRAALQAYVPAQARLGALYEATNRDRAIYWYNQARIGGDAAAGQKAQRLRGQRDIAEVAQWKREEEQKRRQAAEEAREREALRRASEDSEPTPSATIRPTSPFDGLDRINRITLDTVRIANQREADKAAEQRRARAEESRRATEQPRPQYAEASRPVETSRPSSAPQPHASSRPVESSGPVPAPPQTQREKDRTPESKPRATETPGSSVKVEPETCVLEGTGICRGGAVVTRAGAMFTVTQPNHCGYRLYAEICIKTKSGRDDCGAEAIPPGGKMSYWRAGDDATGGFTVTAVGVLKGGDDWSCMSEKRRLGRGD